MFQVGQEVRKVIFKLENVNFAALSYELESRI